MTIPAGLDKACKASAMIIAAAPMLPAALDEIGYSEIMDVLCCKGTFMDGTVSEAHLITFHKITTNCVLPHRIRRIRRTMRR